MKSLLKNIFFRKYSLLFGAALLFTLSLVFNKLYSNRSSVAQEVKLAEKYIHHQYNDFGAFTRDTVLINRLLAQAETINEFNHLAAKKYTIFLYSEDLFGNSDMRFWSDHLVVPPADILTATDGEFFLKELNGWYYVIKKIVPGRQERKLIAVAMVPVRSEFFITTDYLPQRFFYSNSADKRVRISETVTDFPVKTTSGETLFIWIEKYRPLCPTMTKKRSF
ncbi:MAG: hypothetical protein IPP43_02065 [Chitinophagaceae bacterium]|nr:hypothetical protein [Chitinophagaceae bacterium]